MELQQRQIFHIWKPKSVAARGLSHKDIPYLFVYACMHVYVYIPVHACSCGLACMYVYLFMKDRCFSVLVFMRQDLSLDWNC